MKKSLMSCISIAVLLGSFIPFSNAASPAEENKKETPVLPNKQFLEVGLEALKVGEKYAPNEKIGTYIAAGIVLTKGAIAALELGAKLYEELGPPLKAALTKAGEALTTTTQEISQVIGDSHLTVALGDKGGRLLGLLIFDIHASPHQRNLYTAYAVDPNDFGKLHVVGEGRVQLAFPQQDRNQVLLSFIQGTIKGYLPSVFRPGPWLTLAFPLIAIQSSGADANGMPATFVKGFTNVEKDVKGVKYTLYAPLVKAATISYTSHEGVSQPQSPTSERPAYQMLENPLLIDTSWALVRKDAFPGPNDTIVISGVAYPVDSDLYESNQFNLRLIHLKTPATKAPLTLRIRSASVEGATSGDLSLAPDENTWIDNVIIAYAIGGKNEALNVSTG